ncbi:MAG: hypothetical protein IT204_18225 [Fimbriimonadaceae bacterium]|nr:hypothetical protein [Fimbriimonadaceae bacterium]
MYRVTNRKLGLVAVLGFVAGSLVVGKTGGPTDVPETSGYYSAVMNNIRTDTMGVLPDGLFHGDWPVNRYHLASALDRLTQRQLLEKDAECLKQLIDSQVEGQLSVLRGELSTNPGVPWQIEQLPVGNLDRADRAVRAATPVLRKLVGGGALPETIFRSVDAKSLRLSLPTTALPSGQLLDYGPLRRGQIEVEVVLVPVYKPKEPIRLTGSSEVVLGCYAADLKVLANQTQEAIGILTTKALDPAGKGLAPTQVAFRSVESAMDLPAAVSSGAYLDSRDPGDSLVKRQMATQDSSLIVVSDNLNTADQVAASPQAIAAATDKSCVEVAVVGLAIICYQSIKASRHRDKR